MDQEKEPRQLEDDELDAAAGGYSRRTETYACDRGCGNTSDSFGRPCPCGGLFRIQVFTT